MAPPDASLVWSHAALALTARSVCRAVRRADKPFQHRREERPGYADPVTVTQPRKGTRVAREQEEISWSLYWTGTKSHLCRVPPKERVCCYIGDVL